jgi:hypothetical protein
MYAATARHLRCVRARRAEGLGEIIARYTKKASGSDALLTNPDTPDLATSQYRGVVNYPRLVRAF